MDLGVSYLSWKRVKHQPPDTDAFGVFARSQSLSLNKHTNSNK